MSWFVCYVTQELINDQLSAATSQQSSEHSEYPAETSLEDGNYISVSNQADPRLY